MAVTTRRAPDGPVPYADFTAVKWRGRFFWFRLHEKKFVRRLFAAAAGGPAVLAAELPPSMGAATSDARGTLIVDGPGGTVRLAARPHYLLSRPAGR